MKYTARKNGNSISITIPIFVRDKLGIKDGDKMNIELQGKKIIITKEEK